MDEYIWQRQTYDDIAKKYGKSEKWVQRILDVANVKNIVSLNPRPLVIVADVTFFSRINGLCVFREPNLKKNVWWRFTPNEKIDVYLTGRQHLEKNGFQIKAIVLDGKPGVRHAFSDIPVQMCHFHQKQIIKRYLTNKPKLEASIELKKITSTLTETNEEKLEAEFKKHIGPIGSSAFHELKEKGMDEENIFSYIEELLEEGILKKENAEPFKRAVSTILSGGTVQEEGEEKIEPGSFAGLFNVGKK